jgi:hypothetical protein
MQEAMKNMKGMDEFIKNSDFERRLDEFLESKLAQGIDPEEILRNATKNMKLNRGDNESEDEGQEFDPSGIDIDPELFKMFD